MWDKGSKYCAVQRKARHPVTLSAILVIGNAMRYAFIIGMQLKKKPALIPCRRLFMVELHFSGPLDDPGQGIQLKG